MEEETKQDSVPGTPESDGLEKIKENPVWRVLLEITAAEYLRKRDPSGPWGVTPVSFARNFINAEGAVDPVGAEMAERYGGVPTDLVGEGISDVVEKTKAKIEKAAEFSEADLLAEMEEYKRRQTEKGSAGARNMPEGLLYFPKYTNNFFCKMPGGMNRAMDGQLDTRPFSERLHKDIDRIVEELQLNKEQLTAWGREYLPVIGADYYGKTPEEKTERIGVVMKIYIKLRQIGYTPEALFA